MPLGLARLDYGTREVTLLDFIDLGGDEVHDMARVAAAYRGVQGCRPGNAAPIRLLDPSVARSETISK